MSMKSNVLPALSAGFWGLTCLGASIASCALADTIKVDVTSNRFTPQNINIHVGDTVEWNVVDSGHTVTSGSSCNSPDGVFDSGSQTLPAGMTFSHTFEAAGTFPYFCRPHCSIGMTGSVKVASGPGPNQPNKAPTLKIKVSNNSPNRTSRMIDEGETVNIQVLGKDPDRDDVTLDATSLPPGASWIPAGGKRPVGRFSWTPGPGTASTQPMASVVFSATDNPRNGADPLTTTETVTLTVGQNSPPQLADIPAQTVAVGRRLKLKVTATDADGDKLKFLLPPQDLPAGAKFRPGPSKRGSITGTLNWKPTPDQADREFRVTFTVQDNFRNPAQDSTEVVFTVVSP